LLQGLIDALVPRRRAGRRVPVVAVDRCDRKKLQTHPLAEIHRVASRLHCGGLRLFRLAGALPQGNLSNDDAADKHERSRCGSERLERGPQEHLADSSCNGVAGE